MVVIRDHRERKAAVLRRPGKVDELFGLLLLARQRVADLDLAFGMPPFRGRHS